MKRWKIILAFVAVFLAGAIAGGVSAIRFAPMPFREMPDPAKLAAGLLHRLSSDLALRPEQVASIKPVLERSTEKAVGLHRQFMQSMGGNMDACDVEIERYLDAEQKAKFEAIRAKRPHFGEAAHTP
jgi:hypothetical protein